MDSRSRSTLFLMEQLIVILVFAVCAAVCVSIFVGSYIMARDSTDMSNALARAESAAECFKAFSGDCERVAAALDGTVARRGIPGAVEVYYDREWQPCGADGAAYVMFVLGRTSSDDPPFLRVADIKVDKFAGDEIIALTVAARGETAWYE